MHRDGARVAGFRVAGRQCGREAQGVARQVGESAGIAHDDVRTGNAAADVQPEILGARQLECQHVVVGRRATDEDDAPVGRDEAAGYRTALPDTGIAIGLQRLYTAFCLRRAHRSSRRTMNSST